MNETPCCGIPPRRRDVWRLLALGMSNKQIARELGISPHTVHNHVAAVFRAFDANSRIALAHAAMLLGVVSQEEVRAALPLKVQALRAAQCAQHMDDLLALSVEMGVYRGTDQEQE